MAKKKYSSPEAQAQADAERDSMGTYGRGHGSHIYYGPRGDTEGVVGRHHSGDTYYERCPECRLDAKKGEHPNAPK